MTTSAPPSSPAPNFLIVGAAKAGTSSLWHWLSRHPQVFMPDNKEPSFFVHGYGLTDWDEYLSLFAAAGDRPCRGEASASYLAAPESAPWIFDKLGRIKIIILLRHPVQRAFSLYCWMLMEGYEPIESFEAALEQETFRLGSAQFQAECPQYFADYLYFTSGLYCSQVERYLQVFGKDAVKICLFEDLVNRPGEFYPDICTFLGISAPSSLEPAAKNPSVAPRSIALQAWLRARRRRLEARWGRFGLPPAYLCRALMKLNAGLGQKPRLPAIVREKLAERYRADVTNLSSLIGRDLSAWVN